MKCIRPRVNVFDDGRSLVVHVGLPGLGPDTPGRLMIGEDAIAVLARIGGAGFARLIPLDVAIDVDDIATSFEDGMLVVRAPKLRQRGPARVAA